MYMIFILIGMGFLMLSVKFSFSIGVCILYAGCSLFCLLLAAAMIEMRAKEKEAEKIREFFMNHSSDDLRILNMEGYHKEDSQ